MSTVQRLVIDQQLAAIGVRTTPAQMHITMPRLQMHIMQEAPEMTIDRTDPSFKVNWNKVYDESGLKKPANLSKAMESHAKSGVRSYTVEAVHEGDFIGKVEQPGNRIAQLSRKKMLETADVEINIENMPKNRPEVDWTPGSIDITWSSHKFKIEWEGDHLPEILIDPPYSVEVFLRNKPYFKISVIEGALSTVGHVVDESL